MTIPVSGVLFALCALVLVPLQQLSIRLGMRRGGTFGVVNSVLILNVAVFVPIAIVWHYPDYGLSLFSLVAFSASGLMGSLLGRFCMFHSIGLIGASRTEPIKSSYPLFGVILALLILGESMTPQEGVGMLFIAGGAVLISWEMASSNADRDKPLSFVSLVFPVSSAFFFGADPIFVKWGFQEGTPLLVALAIKVVAALFFYWGFLLSTGRFREYLNIFHPDRYWFLAAGVANTLFLCFYFAALEIAPVVLVLPILQTSPLAVAALSLLFLPRLEKITLPLVISCLGVTVGAILLSLS